MGSGRDITIGFVVMAVAFAVSVVTDATGGSETIGGATLLALSAALGASLRYRATAREHLVERVRVEEREQLARELHDTVAHHVSAIAVQAQAGLALARSASLGASEALEVIDREAAWTLAEMRTMVGALRNRRYQPDPHPARRGVADVENLATTRDGSPRVDVVLRGDLLDIPPAVSAAVYRVAQESVTNPQRHAHRASQIDVTVTGTATEVQVTVLDDGGRAANAPGQVGYGQIGMTERVSLLGGTLTVGPGAACVWVVRAVLPRTGTAR
ncbi:MAG: sensor histidine kinase [Jiangellaceae bacterium]